MSGLLMNRAWLGGAALVLTFSFAACSGDDDDSSGGTAGESGHAGSTQGGTATAGSNSNGGKAGEAAAGKGGMSNGGKGGMSDGGKGGMPSAGSANGGTTSTPGGEGGMAGVGGDDNGGAGGEGGEPADPDAELRQLFQGMSPLPAVPADTTNKYADNAAAATLGQRFFFDEKFSGKLTVDGDLTLGNVGDAGKVSCRTCHAKPAMDDGRATSLGTGKHSRNSPPIINSAFYDWTNWGGRFSAQWELPIAVVENPVTMNGNRLALAHRIFDVYKTEYEAVFETTLPPEIGTDAVRFPPSGKPKAAGADDGDWEKMTAEDRTTVNRILVNFSKALQAYMRKLVSREAAFDAFMAGDDAALSASAKNGARVFAGKAGCINCHSGATFSDQGFHKLVVGGAADDGRFKDIPGLLGSAFNRNGDFSDDKNTHKLDGLTNPAPDAWKGLFRTPSLRGVTGSAPYMHAGQLATLEAVIDFYAAGGGAQSELTPFTISAQERTDLIAFLQTLSGKDVPAALLLDTAKD